MQRGSAYYAGDTEFDWHEADNWHDTNYGTEEPWDPETWDPEETEDYYYDGGAGEDWWFEDYNLQNEPEAEDDEDIKALREEEAAAAALAAEAYTTLEQARKAVAAAKKDRAFGGKSKGVGKGGAPSRVECFRCGGNHFARQCPKGKGQGQGHLGGPSQPAAFYAKGKGGKRTYGNFGNFGKGKSKGKGKPRPPQLFVIEEVMRASGDDGLEDPEALMDSGATTTAGGEDAVTRLINAVLKAHPETQVEVRKDNRPQFKFGDGKLGRALYQVLLKAGMCEWSVFGL